MIDEIFDRNYQSGRAQLNESLATLFGGIGKSIGDSFRVLNRIEYNAPWLERKRSRRHA